jgi:hypothetical protein
MTPAGFARAGSQRWLQVAVKRCAQRIDAPIRDALGIPHRPLAWRSPLEEAGFREYRDMAALRQLGIVRLPVEPLSAFWPRRGPVRDALAIAGTGQPLLVEAKANIPEAASPKTKASCASLKLIQGSLRRGQCAIAPKSEHDWSGVFYQYANRLAHLYLLREVNSLPAELVFVYFINAIDVDGPTTGSEWDAVTALTHAALGLGRHPMLQHVHHVVVDVKNLQDAVSLSS